MEGEYTSGREPAARPGPGFVSRRRTAYVPRMLLTGLLMLPDRARPGSVRLAPGRVRVEGERIAGVEELQDLRVTPETPLITPGFVDAHLHLPQFDSVGVAGLELLEWLRRVVFPAEARWADPAYAEAMTRRVLAQLAAHGTTAFAGYATSHHEGARAAIRLAAEAGFRATIGQVLMDRNAAPELTGTPAHEQLGRAASLRAHGRVEPSVTPRFAVACTPELLAGAGRLAAETGWAVQTHLSETRAELAAVRDLFGETPYARVYDEAGLLTPRTILAHGIWLGGEDRALIAERRAVIAHCPTANLFLESGAFDAHAAAAAGIAVALGSDIAGGFERSMPRVARAMLQTVITRRLGLAGALPAPERPSPEPAAEPDEAALPPLPSAAQAFHAITAGNADVLGWRETGRIEPGAEADLLVLHPDIPYLESQDPLGALLWSWDDRWLRRTILRGATAEPGQSVEHTAR